MVVAVVVVDLAVDDACSTFDVGLCCLLLVKSVVGGAGITRLVLVLQRKT